jgi:transcriptional regulator with XRE-family HTH domain
VRQSSVHVALDRVGHRVAELRNAKGWTQEQTAARLGMPLRNYQKIEAGLRNLTVRTLVGVAAVLDVALDELFVAPAPREARRPGRPPRAPAPIAATMAANPLPAQSRGRVAPKRKQR